ncbi:MAG TPA: hypothetical protein PKY72_05295 [Bacilli bacterium]|nr:hypothetical protein [Bacilli bacterium]
MKVNYFYDPVFDKDEDEEVLNKIVHAQINKSKLNKKKKQSFKREQRRDYS